MVVWLAGFFCTIFVYHFSTTIAYFLILLTTLDYSHSETGIELVVRNDEVILEGIGEKPRKKNGLDGEIRTRDLCPLSSASGKLPGFLMPHFTPASNG